MRVRPRSPGIVDYEPYRELFGEFMDVSRRHLVVNDKTDAAVVAREIRAGLEEGKYRLL